MGIDFNRLNGPQLKILRETLLEVFSRNSLERFFFETYSESVENLVESGPFGDELFDLIKVLRQRGTLSTFVAAVEAVYAANPALGELNARLGLVDEEAHGQPVLSGMSLERMVRSSGFDDVNLWARRLVEAGNRVCRISYPGSQGLVRGTGFLVASDLVLTNYHVIEDLAHDTADSDDVRLSFGYAETAEGLSTGEKYTLAESWLVDSSTYSQADLAPNAGLPSEGELDFALLRLKKPAGEAVGPGGKRGWFDLKTSPDQAPQDGIVFVLQHPEGKPLKQSIGIVKTSLTQLRLRYDADTSHGSSGAVVLDQQLDPVALHHAGDPDSKIKAQYNQGIPLALIRTALEVAPDVTWPPPVSTAPAVALPTVETAPSLEADVTPLPTEQVSAPPVVESVAETETDTSVSETIQQLIGTNNLAMISHWSDRLTPNGGFGDARAVNQALIELATQRNDRQHLAQGNENQGDLYGRHDQQSKAKRYWRESLAHYRWLRNTERDNTRRAQYATKLAAIEAKLTVP